MRQTPGGWLLLLLLVGSGSAVHAYGRPGLYFPRATGSDAQGGQVRATGIAQVHDVAALDGALKGKWQAMKDALRVGDIPRAVSHITGGTREE